MSLREVTITWRLWLNLGLFQGGWFACVLGARLAEATLAPWLLPAQALPAWDDTPRAALISLPESLLTGWRRPVVARAGRRAVPARPLPPLSPAAAVRT